MKLKFVLRHLDWSNFFVIVVVNYDHYNMEVYFLSHNICKADILVGVKFELLNRIYYVYKHLDKPGTSARLLFVDFSSAFNMIQPHLLASKLRNTNVNPTLILWVLDFLMNRSQYVKVNGASSSSRNTNTGAPQGSVISPVLYTMYTSGKCYLPCTVHHVHLREVLSPLYCTPCTPQGSVISPVLYTMYTSGKCYLPCTVHHVHLREVLSPLYCTPCTPQGSVISPVLYTRNCRPIQQNSKDVLLKYADDICLAGFICCDNNTTYEVEVMIYVWLDSSAVTTTQRMK